MQYSGGWMSIPELIDGVLVERQRKLPLICSSRTNIESLEKALGVLDGALEALSQQPRTQPELREVVAKAEIREHRAAVHSILEECRRIEARFSRKTVNFGVSGQARVERAPCFRP